MWGEPDLAGTAGNNAEFGIIQIIYKVDVQRIKL